MKAERPIRGAWALAVGLCLLCAVAVWPGGAAAQSELSPEEVRRLIEERRGDAGFILVDAGLLAA